jgi:hypothetical protein
MLLYWWTKNVDLLPYSNMKRFQVNAGIVVKIDCDHVLSNPSLLISCDYYSLET